jgi:hypothetical protein
VIDLGHLPVCIGIYSPQARSGKGTTTEVLVKHFQYHELRFSDPIRRMWRVFLDDAGFTGDIHETLEGDLKEEKLPCVGMSYREFAEMAGGNARIINPDVWVDIARLRAEWLISEGQDVVFSDLRYPNEYRLCKALGGYTIEVKRTSGTRGFTYPSEGRLCKYEFDACFEASSAEDLREQVKQHFSDFCNPALRALEVLRAV